MGKRTKDETITIPMAKYNELWNDAEKWRRHDDPDVRVVPKPETGSQLTAM